VNEPVTGHWICFVARFFPERKVTVQLNEFIGDMRGHGGIAFGCARRKKEEIGDWKVQGRTACDVRSIRLNL